MLLSAWTLLSFVSLILASPIPPSSIESAAFDKRDTSLNAFLSLILNHLPAVDGSITAVSNVLTVFENFLAFITGEQTTYNQLGGPCTEYTVIFARGTVEPGNVGILVGPPFFKALKSLVGSSSVTIQGVNNYGASVDGFLEGGDPSGGTSMANEIQQAYNSCPNTRLVASGYSQGGQIVHNAAKLLPAAVVQWISSAVIFGDPDDGAPVGNVPASRTAIYCHPGDNICEHGDLILPAHLTYAKDASAAAAFVVAAAG